jgi:CubicO group peptidase (beta-lactamase class C family)
MMRTLIRLPEEDRMRKRLQVRGALVPMVLLLAAVAAWPLVAATTTATPEEVGLSSERLGRVRELIQRHLEAGSFSGAVTLVARHGRIAHHEAYGVMDIASKKPMQKDAIFRIMSMTKPVVGASIMMMIEEGKVRLQDPVSRFIPEFADMTVAVAQPAPAGRGGGAAPAPGAVGPAAPRFYTVPAERPITVRDLLTHTSGLVSGPLGNSEAAKVAAGPTETLADYLPRLGKVPLEFQPGTRWAYSAAAGFDVLARIVEVASGLKYDQFVKQRLFDPLGMRDTTFAPPAGNPRLVTLYSRSPDGLRPQRDPGFMNGVYFSGGGGLFSTAEDYLQFAQMLLDEGQGNGKRLLSPRGVELMRSVVAPDTLPGRPRGEGYGLSVRVVNDPVARNSFLSEGSFGWSGLFGTHFWVDPQEKVVGILMTQTSAPGITADFENAVMQAVVGSGAASAAGTN